MLTREERNVLAFVAVGVVLGSLPVCEPEVGSVPPDDASGVAAVEETDLFPIDLNRAGPELLAELPGIGPAKAQAIVDLRETRGTFGSVDELEEVRGIGPRTVDRLRELVTVGTDARERESLVRTTRDPASGKPDPRQGAARPGP
ncbi:MAG: helix-hairpin-helix domain-containing protein [Gemmatimonadetes bacterium]|nr:helix-hairpin-helix domain-containing protein [Gemmatimonadota bacterium]